MRSRRTWIEFGLFSTDLLRSIGGYNAAEPCGQDSVVTSILAQSPGVRHTTQPTYHKVYRADSLTHDPRTRQGSEIRVGVKARNHDVLLACQGIGWRTGEAIWRYRDGLVPPALRGELEDRAGEVARWLA